MNSVGSPTKKTRVHIVQLSFLSGRCLDIGRLDTTIDFGVLTVLIVLVLVELVGIIWRVADDDTNLALILPFDPRDIFLADRSEHILLVARELPQGRNIIERVNKT